MSAIDALARLGTEVAEDQWGLVTRAQAMDLGVPAATFARLTGAGVLVRVAHGVYRVVGGADPGHVDLRAAWLQLDAVTPAWKRVRATDAAVVSHRSAAELFGLGDLIADIHEFSVPFRQQTRRTDIRLHLRPVPAGDRELLHGLPVTRPHRLAADLVAAHEDGAAVAAIVAEAIERRLTTAIAVGNAVARVDPDHGLVRDLLGRAA
ncbi:type IV toxin-antitoxin system AbiEi family antitoxin domain-containing protein [Longispora sp. K20-0274]|uniref:type IV toxin-antitoxin system AbiEi family antitoxin domain-containing protein n=1 Tax=Longispora sp. K20-0274 TaxID=3088255 RepID=UPI00399AECEA